MADPKELDGDVLIAAQALEVMDAIDPGGPAVVATSNPGHLGRVPGVVAARWQDLPPGRLLRGEWA